MPWPHPTPIVAVACASDGSAIATGSGGAPAREPDAPMVGVTIWDIARSAPRVTSPVEGGVSAAPRSGSRLQFSSDGRRLGFNHLENAVGVLDTRSGRVHASALASARLTAPSFALSPGGERLVVGAADDTPGAWATTFSVSSGGPLARLRAPAASRSLEVLAWRDGLVYGLDADALVALDPSTGAIVRSEPLPERVDLERVWCAPGSGDVWLATERGLARRSLDGEPGVDLPISGVRALAFAAGARTVGIVRHDAEHGEEALVLDGGAILARIPGPFARAEERAPDVAPLALEPGGSAVAVARPGGRIEGEPIEIVRASGSFTRMRLPAIEGASALLWPAPDVLVALGPRVVAFFRPSGELLARYAPG